MKKALFYKSGEDSTVSCNLCHHHCSLKDGQRGICGVRENIGGVLYSLVYNKIVAEHVDPIEKKPLFHFLPGSTSYSISTVGCNFRCQHCQNYEISQFPHQHNTIIAGQYRTPEEIVSSAIQAGCRSLSYTYVEPTIFYEFAYDCAVLAHEQGLKNVFVSNGYMDEKVTRHMSGVIDAINIDIKAFGDKFYTKVCGARLAPVLDNVRLFKSLGIWLEITTLIIPGWNDSAEELQKIARFIKEVDPYIPWHVTAFYPTFKMLDRPATGTEILQKARDIGLQEGLSYVYEGNIPGHGGENTYCPACGKKLISRSGYRINSCLVEQGKCPWCQELIDGVW